ncbi:MAG TPA: twin-arginine translocation signal domain-containing protein, partial [Noviherbaspirillum sp.]
MPNRLSRRQFLQTGALLAAGIALPAADVLASDDWHAGELAHLLPAASHERFLIKASFRTPLTEAPRLSVNGRNVVGQR